MIHNLKELHIGIHKRKMKKGLYRSTIIHLNGKKIRYARAIMENYLNRRLKTKEVVHHINKDTLDNRISNLKLMFNSEHNRLHSSGKNNAMYGKRSPNWNRVKIKCLICGKEVYKKHYTMIYKKHFCSNECARKYNEKISVKCPFCNKTTLKFPSEVKRNRRFCSLQCSYNYKKSNPHLYYTDISNRPRDEYGRLKAF